MRGAPDVGEMFASGGRGKSKDDAGGSSGVAGGCPRGLATKDVLSGLVGGCV